jgi:hypothetical protein
MLARSPGREEEAAGGGGGGRGRGEGEEPGTVNAAIFSVGLRSEANEGYGYDFGPRLKPLILRDQDTLVVPARSFVVYSLLQYRKVGSGARLRASRANSAVFSSTRSTCAPSPLFLAPAPVSLRNRVTGTSGNLT